MSKQGKLPFHLVPSRIYDGTMRYYARTAPYKTVGQEEIMRLSHNYDCTVEK